MSIYTLKKQENVDRLRQFFRAGSFRSTVPAFIFVILLVWRTPNLFVRWRFWAEEGPLYYGYLQNMAPLKGLVRIFNGNYQFLTNAIVELALRVPIRYAPFVTTYAGVALAVICAWMIGRLLLSSGCSVPLASAGCAIFALQPAGYEVFLNTTNIQWVTSVIGLLLCLREDVPATSLRAFLCYLVLVFCGLTGTTTCILLPLFVVRAMWQQSRFGWTMSAVLGVVTALQAGIVLAHRAEMHRTFAISDHSVLPLVFQVIFVQFISGDILDILGASLRAHTGVVAIQALQWAVIGLGGMALIAQMATRRLGVLMVSILLASAVAISLVNEFGSQATADQMLSGSAGGRYFFLGATSLLILLAATGRTSTMTGRIAGWVMIILVLTNDVTTAMFAQWPLMTLTGPSFSEQIDSCEGAPTCEIKVWPAFYRGKLVVRMPPSRSYSSE